MIPGGFLTAPVSGKTLTNHQMGLFTTPTDWPPLAYLLWFFAGGTLLGPGARLAGGCTSGHSIHGLATGQKPSLAAMGFFLLFGVSRPWLVRHFVFGGV